MLLKINCTTESAHWQINNQSGRLTGANNVSQSAGYPWPTSRFELLLNLLFVKRNITSRVIIDNNWNVRGKDTQNRYKLVALVCLCLIVATDLIRPGCLWLDRQMQCIFVNLIFCLEFGHKFNQKVKLIGQQDKSVVIFNGLKKLRSPDYIEPIGSKNMLRPHEFSFFGEIHIIVQSTSFSRVWLPLVRSFKEGMTLPSIT